MKQTRKLLRSKSRNTHKKNKSRKCARKLRNKSYKGGSKLVAQRGGDPPAPPPIGVDSTIYFDSLKNSLGTFASAVYAISQALDSGSQAASLHISTTTSDVGAASNLLSAVTSLYTAFYGDGSATPSGFGLFQTMLPGTALPAIPTYPVPPPSAWGFL